MEDLALDFLRSLEISVNCREEADESKEFLLSVLELNEKCDFKDAHLWFASAEDPKIDTVGSEEGDDPVESVEAAEVGWSLLNNAVP